MPFIDSVKFVEVIRDDAELLNTGPNDVISGKIFVGRNKKFETGNIPIINQLSDIILNAGDSYNVPFGYNTKEYTVRSVDLASQTVSNAADSDILSGKTAWVNGSIVVGSMENNGSFIRDIQPGTSIEIPIGFHDGTGNITCPKLDTFTIGTATSKDIILGKTAWVNGKLCAGEMQVNNAEIIVIKPGETYIIQEGYHNGKGSVKASELSSITVGDATENDLLEGKIAWVNGKRITGNIKNINEGIVKIEINGTYSIKKGYHPGTEIVTQEIPTKDGFTITPTFAEQNISVKDHYMVGDILVSGIKSFNHNSSYGTYFKQKDISLTIEKSDIENPKKTMICRINTDNWHDNMTNNVFHIICKCKSIGGDMDQKVAFAHSGDLFYNSLINDNKNLIPQNHPLMFSIYSKQYANYREDLILSFIIENEIATSSIIIYAIAVYTKTNSSGNLEKTTIPSSFESIQGLIDITELDGYRRYGDLHDI